MEVKQIMAAEKMRWKSYCVYPIKITEISSLGKLQEKLMEHNNCFYVASISKWRIRKFTTIMSLVRKINFKQIPRNLFQFF